MEGSTSRSCGTPARACRTMFVRCSNLIAAQRQSQSSRPQDGSSRPSYWTDEGTLATTAPKSGRVRAVGSPDHRREWREGCVDSSGKISTRHHDQAIGHHWRAVRAPARSAHRCGDCEQRWTDGRGGHYGAGCDLWPGRAQKRSVRAAGFGTHDHDRDHRVPRARRFRSSHRPCWHAIFDTFQSWRASALLG